MALGQRGQRVEPDARARDGLQGGGPALRVVSARKSGAGRPVAKTAGASVNSAAATLNLQLRCYSGSRASVTEGHFQ
jgi:hypothetical protein